MAGLLLGQILFAAIGLKIFSGKINHENMGVDKVPLSHIKSLFMFAWPVMLAAGLNWLQTQGYRFFMSSSLGLSSLGVFVAGYGLSAGLVAGLESMLITYFQPLFYRRVCSGLHADQAAAWNQYASAIFPSLLILIFFVMAVSSQITHLLLGPRYAASAQYVVWGTLAEATRVVASVYSMAAHARMKTTWLLLPNLIGALLSVALVAYLVPRLGASGAGIALTLTGVILIGVWHMKIRKELFISLPYALLVKSISMGCGLLVAALFFQTILKDISAIQSAFIMILVLGICFLAMQYLVLVDSIKKSA